MAIETELRELIDRNLPADSAPLVAAFAGRLFARDSADNRDRVPAKRRLALVQSAFEFFSVRTEPVIARVETVAGNENGNDTLAVVETVTPDCPFIVDSLLEYFHHLGASVRTVLHPILYVARDKEGRIASFEQSSSTERGESFVHAELELVPTPEQARQIERDVVSILTEVHEATDDFEEMTGRALQICEETASRRELIELRDLLRWLIQGGFVFLGYRRYLVSGDDGTAKFVFDPDTELGIMRNESQFRTSIPLEELSPARRKLYFEGPPIVVGKSPAESHVHRRRPMDSVSIRRVDASGRVVAFDNFVGLFTSKAYAEEAQHIPVLRAKLREVLESEGAAPGSHDYKEIVSAFNSFPKDELFRAPVAELRAQLRLILDVKSEAAVRLFIAPDIRHGNVIAMVVMPREAGSAELSRRIQETLATALNGQLVYFYLALGEGYTARLHFCFVADPPKTSVIRGLQTTIAELARRWDDRLQERLIEKFGPKLGRERAERWAGAFSAEYQAAVDVSRALADIEDVETLISGARDFIVEAGPHATDGNADDGRSDIRPSDIRIVGLGDPPMLSDLMPTLQNFAI
ncbi:MAG TPA: hypothetical protein VE243_04630, partial [Candidatus Acidoferrum sp.]|nr:hypothetical protein [Candidatus Acidoferrum sp.]